MKCAVHTPAPCVNEAEFQAVKPCGCESSICGDCLSRANDYVITCAFHGVFFERGEGYIFVA